MALGVAGVRVGVWTSPDGPTGCTVVLAPFAEDRPDLPPTVGSVAVRGSSPGTREAVALGPAGKVEVCHAVVLAGGSAYGLAAADGVMRWLEARGVGYDTRAALVPIVGAAIVLDQGVSVPTARPDAAAGASACDVATTAEPPEGAVGAGRGCTVAKVGGIEHCWRGGQGVAVARHGELTVGALVVNNAVGEVVGDDGRPIAASRAPDGAPRFPYADAFAAPESDDPPSDGGLSDGGASAEEGSPLAAGGTRAAEHRRRPDGGLSESRARPGGVSEHTVIGCIATNARLDKRATWRVADLGHTGLARALRPAHTELDGDALFCLATGEVDAGLDLVATLAADAVAEACRRGPLAATGHAGIPGLADA